MDSTPNSNLNLNQAISPEESSTDKKIEIEEKEVIKGGVKTSPSPPTWTPEEDAAFLKALKTHGYGEWAAITKIIGGAKIWQQVASRAKIYMSRKDLVNTELATLLKQKKEQFLQKKAKRRQKGVKGVVKSESQSESGRRTVIPPQPKSMSTSTSGTVLRNILPAPSKQLSAAVVVPSSPKTKTKTKKTYTRKAVTRRKINNETEIHMNSGEEISIMSSSGSESGKSSVTNSINIMSSSSSSSVSTISEVNEATMVAVTQDNEVEESSSWSTSDSSDSIKSLQSSTSLSEFSVETFSLPDSDLKTDKIKDFLNNYTRIPVVPTTPIDFESVQDWERAACPALLGNGNESKQSGLLKDKRYMQLRRWIVSSQVKFKESPLHESEVINLIKKYSTMYSKAAIKQVIDILTAVARDDALSVSGTQTFKQDKTRRRKGKKSAIKEEIVQSLNAAIQVGVGGSSTRKRKVRTEEGDWISPEELKGRVIVHSIPGPKTPRVKRKKRVVEADDFAEGGEDPFRLILLNDFNEKQEHEQGQGQEQKKKQKRKSSSADDEVEEADDIVMAPFSVEISVSVILLMDLHAHLHSSEIIGLLGGSFDTDTTTLRITYGYPCSTSHSTGTQVDVDPLSEMEAGVQFEGRGIKMAGWYHSHPNFEPNPSMRDLETQNMYQGLFRNSQPNCDIEPFVGIIINPYMAITESSSHIECFYLLPSKEHDMDASYERIPYRLVPKTLPFQDEQEEFDGLLSQMAAVIQVATESSDSLDMNKRAETGGIKRMDKLLNSLQFHGQLNPNQMDRIKKLLMLHKL